MKLKFRTTYKKGELDIYKKEDWFGDNNNLGSIAIDLDPNRVAINTIDCDSVLELQKPMTVDEYLENFSLIRPLKAELTITSENTSSELNDYEYTDRSMSVASVTVDVDNDDMLFNKNALNAQHQTKAWINVGEHYPSCNILLYSTMPIFKRLFSSVTDEISEIVAEFTYEAMVNTDHFIIPLAHTTTPFSELYNNMLAGTLGGYKEVVRTIDITNTTSTCLDINRLDGVTGTYLDLGLFSSVWIKRESLFKRIFKKNTVDIIDLAEIDCPIGKDSDTARRNISGDIIVEYGNTKYAGLHSHGTKLVSYFDHVYSDDDIRLADYKNDIIANRCNVNSYIIDSLFVNINGSDCIDIDKIDEILYDKELNPTGKEITLKINSSIPTGASKYYQCPYAPMQLDLKFYTNKNTGNLCVDWVTYIDLYCNKNNPYFNEKQSLLEIDSQFNIQVTIDKEYWEGPENAKAASGNYSVGTDTNQD